MPASSRVADGDEGKARAAAAAFPGAQVFATADAMIAAVRPGVVDIVTPPATHLALVSAAARHGVAGHLPEAARADL